MSRRGLALAVVVVGGLLGGCSSDILGTSKLSNMFGSSPPSAQPGADPSNPTSAASTDYDCPPVEIRTGASSLQVGPPSDEQSATSVRYQASFSQTARDCTLRSGTLTMKVGVQGRVALGPSGAPGNFAIPLRVAIVREGIDPKTILSKLQPLNVTIETGQTAATFTTVLDGLSFPMPSDLDAYVVYVGFDPQGAPKPVAKKPPPKRKPATPPA